MLETASSENIKKWIMVIILPCPFSIFYMIKKLSKSRQIWKKPSYAKQAYNITYPLISYQLMSKFKTMLTLIIVFCIFGSVDISPTASLTNCSVFNSLCGISIRRAVFRIDSVNVWRNNRSRLVSFYSVIKMIIMTKK